MTTGHEPWLEPDPQVGQDGHIKDHKNWRNWFKQFWEDVEAGNYPGLIGPEGPQGPVGPDGPPGEDGADGEDGKTPKVLHQSWSRTVPGDQNEFSFDLDPEADTGNGYDPDTAHVHLNGVLLQPNADYSVRVEGDQANPEDKNLIVTLRQPTVDGDVIHVQMLFAFAAVARSERATQYMVDFGDVGGAERLDIDNEDYRKLHGDRLFIVLND